MKEYEIQGLLLSAIHTHKQIKATTGASAYKNKLASQIQDLIDLVGPTSPLAQPLINTLNKHKAYSAPHACRRLGHLYEQVGDELKMSLAQWDMLVSGKPTLEIQENVSNMQPITNLAPKNKSISELLNDMDKPKK